MRLSEGRIIMRREVGGEREESERNNIVKVYVILEENVFLKSKNFLRKVLSINSTDKMRHSYAEE